MKRIIPAVAAIIVIVGIVFGWDRIAPTLGLVPETASRQTVSIAPEDSLIESVLRVRYVALDPTGSTSPLFAQSIKAAILAAVSAHLPAKPQTTKAGVAPVAGLSLTVKLVTTQPLQYGQPNYTVRIPAVPGLTKRPDPLSEGSTERGGPYTVWKAAESTWSAQWDVAAATQQDSLATLEGIDLGIQQSSGITAAVSALAELIAPEADNALLIASDLEETVPTQTAGSLAGATVTVIQPNPWGDAAVAEAHYVSFADWAKQLGAGEITRTQPELAETTIATFLNGDLK